MLGEIICSTCLYRIICSFLLAIGTEELNGAVSSISLKTRLASAISKAVEKRTLYILTTLTIENQRKARYMKLRRN